MSHDAEDRKQAAGKFVERAILLASNPLTPKDEHTAEWQSTQLEGWNTASTEIEAKLTQNGMTRLILAHAAYHCIELFNLMKTMDCALNYIRQALQQGMLELTAQKSSPATDEPQVADWDQRLIPLWQTCADSFTYTDIDLQNLIHRAAFYAPQLFIAMKESGAGEVEWYLAAMQQKDRVSIPMGRHLTMHAVGGGGGDALNADCHVFNATPLSFALTQRKTPTDILHKMLTITQREFPAETEGPIYRVGISKSPRFAALFPHLNADFSALSCAVMGGHAELIGPISQAMQRPEYETKLHTHGMAHQHSFRLACMAERKIPQLIGAILKALVPLPVLEFNPCLTGMQTVYQSLQHDAINPTLAEEIPSWGVATQLLVRFITNPVLRLISFTGVDSIQVDKTLEEIKSSIDVFCQTAPDAQQIEEKKQATLDEARALIHYDSDSVDRQFLAIETLLADLIATKVTINNINRLVIDLINREGSEEEKFQAIIATLNDLVNQAPPFALVQNFITNIIKAIQNLMISEKPAAECSEELAHISNLISKLTSLDRFAQEQAEVLAIQLSQPDADIKGEFERLSRKLTSIHQQDLLNLAQRKLNSLIRGLTYPAKSVLNPWVIKIQQILVSLDKKSALDADYTGICELLVSLAIQYKHPDIEQRQFILNTLKAISICVPKLYQFKFQLILTIANIEFAGTKAITTLFKNFATIATAEQQDQLIETGVSYCKNQPPIGFQMMVIATLAEVQSGGDSSKQAQIMDDWERQQGFIDFKQWLTTDTSGKVVSGNTYDQVALIKSWPTKFTQGVLPAVLSAKSLLWTQKIALITEILYHAHRQSIHLETAEFVEMACAQHGATALVRPIVDCYEARIASKNSEAPAHDTNITHVLHNSVISTETLTVAVAARALFGRSTEAYSPLHAAALRMYLALAASSSTSSYREIECKVAVPNQKLNRATLARLLGEKSTKPWRQTQEASASVQTASAV